MISKKQVSPPAVSLIEQSTPASGPRSAPDCAITRCGTAETNGGGGGGGSGACGAGEMAQPPSANKTASVSQWVCRMVPSLSFGGKTPGALRGDQRRRALREGGGAQGLLDARAGLLGAPAGRRHAHVARHHLSGAGDGELRRNLDGGRGRARQRLHC